MVFGLTVECLLIPSIKLCFLLVVVNDRITVFMFIGSIIELGQILWALVGCGPSHESVR